LIASAGALPALAEKRADSTIGPWDVKALQKPPKFELGPFTEVMEGDAKVQIAPVYYEGEVWSGHPTRVFAYYARPALVSEKRLPAMTLVHGGGGKAFPEWARMWAARGYCALAMDLGGMGPDGKPLPDAGPDQSDQTKFLKIKDGVKEAWPYYAVAAVLRGTSVLLAQPEVDKKRVGMTGISWGGYLTSLVIGLDDRLKCAIPVYGCGFLHENSVWLPILGQMPEADRRAWIENFDPSRYLARSKIPVLWMNGTNDFAYPLDSYQKSYRAAKGPRTLCITVKMPHSHPDGWARSEIARFADSFINKGRFDESLAVIHATGIDQDKLKIAYESEVAILKCQIHWTTDLDKPWQQRDWKTATGRVIGLLEAEADLPKERPCVYFATLTDHTGAVVSTEHAELK
jgi:cephalosporin-C deacetylase-like acetyl esterase